MVVLWGMILNSFFQAVLRVGSRFLLESEDEPLPGPLRISTGFLTGNLVANAGGVDEEATARGFAEALAYAIAEQYPAAEVTVDWNEGSGLLPQELWTAVNYNPGHREVDGVNRIIGAVITKGDFYVRESARTEPCRAGATGGCSLKPEKRSPAPAKSADVHSAFSVR